jgi:pyruvate/2-oxoacid:ferredoxin oxidoreductase beta subunit/Pyruvate/2-oxoacid:ferredoxin oxidoreductase gamma subunit
MINDHLNKALVKLQLDPSQVVLVSDIGCVGLSDQYFTTSAFHGLHGRSVAYASGIKLARPDLKVIVQMGDGGCGIGGTHLINAARRNIGVTVLVFNNFNFGMTGGEHSVTTPTGGVTSTTRGGNLERPLDLCATVAVNGASYVYRGTSFDKDLPDRIAEAIQNEGFSLLDIWELCTAYYVPNNDFSRKALMETITTLQFPTGVIHREERSEYAAELHRTAQEQRGQPPAPKPVETKFATNLNRKANIVIAGSAGGKVRSSARLLGLAGMLCGLWAAQRDDYPVTVNTGHSVSEIVLSPQEIRYAGVPRPDVLLVVSENGYKKVTHHLPHLTADDWLFVTSEFANVEAGAARKVVLDLGRVNRKNIALAAIAAALKATGYLPVESLQEAARVGVRQDIAEENLQAIVAGAASVT